MLSPGTMVAGYRIERALGEGAMSTVYRATHAGEGRTVALKLLLPELAAVESFRRRFEREGRLQAILRSEHIVPVYDWGASEHGLFLAMRLISGPNLKELIRQEALDAGRSIRLLRQVADALTVAHEAGLVHRDIKPQNVLVESGDHVYLADFGLLKSQAESALTSTGQTIGTIDYMSPEQIQGEAPSGASDTYALAGVLYECMTGAVPFDKPTEAATLYAHMLLPPPQPTQVRPDLPAAFDTVIERGMAKDPAARPAPRELIDLAAHALGLA